MRRTMKKQDTTGNREANQAQTDTPELAASANISMTSLRYIVAVDTHRATSSGQPKLAESPSPPLVQAYAASNRPWT